MWANFISHCDKGAIFHNFQRKLFHIRRKPNISLEKLSELWYNNEDGEPMITNEKLLDFIFEQDFKNKTETINYINSLSAEHVIRSDSKCYKIIEFRTPNI